MKKRFNRRSQQRLQVGVHNTGKANPMLRDATSLTQAAKAMVAIQKRARAEAEQQRRRDVDARLNKLLRREP
jgi:hypothetical protein